MALNTLNVGMKTITQNIVYGLPHRPCLLFSNVALECSNTENFAVKQDIAAGTTVLTAAPFVRCTVSDALVSLRVY